MTRMMHSEFDSPRSRNFFSRRHISSIDRYLPVAIWQSPRRPLCYREEGECFFVSDDCYDAIIIGSGPGGGAAASRIAKTGKRILIVERGNYLQRERWDTSEVFAKARYQVKEAWYSSSGQSFRPGLHYFVGGNSKVCGAALFRLRKEDFAQIKFPDGLSPERPVHSITS
jgi:hypothetical protein